MNKKRLQKQEPFFAISKHRANRIFHKFTFSSWLQQILILSDSSQRRALFRGRAAVIRRVGGLEVAGHRNGVAPTVIRRVGGLEALSERRDFSAEHVQGEVDAGSRLSSPYGIPPSSHIGR